MDNQLIKTFQAGEIYRFKERCFPTCFTNIKTLKEFLDNRGGDFYGKYQSFPLEPTEPNNFLFIETYTYNTLDSNRTRFGSVAAFILFHIERELYFYITSDSGFYLAFTSSIEKVS
jgi:hypothetical protein